MCHETTKRKKKLLYRTIIAMSIFSLLSGLFGCGGSGQSTSSEVNQIVSFSTTSQSSMSRRPTYAFALHKKDGEWFFSADCYVDNPQSHYTSFSSFPIPAEDAQGLLKIIDEEQELQRLRNYREPFLTRLFAPLLLDGGWDYTRVAFTDLEPLEREILPCDKVRDYLRDLAEKHCQAAESVEMKAVSINRSCMDHSSSYSFTLEKDGDHWFFSFDAAIHRSGAHTEVKGLRIEDDAAEEILRIAKEQQLVNKVKQYEQPPDDGIVLLDETTYQTSFRFMDGSSIYAPIDAGDELAGAFYSLAQANTCPE